MLIFQIQKQLQFQACRQAGRQAQKQKLLNEEQCFLKGNNSTTQDYLQNNRKSNSSGKHNKSV